MYHGPKVDIRTLFAFSACYRCIGRLPPPPLSCFVPKDIAISCTHAHATEPVWGGRRLPPIKNRAHLYGHHLRRQFAARRKLVSRDTSARTSEIIEELLAAIYA